MYPVCINNLLNIQWFSDLIFEESNKLQYCQFCDVSFTVFFIYKPTVTIKISNTSTYQYQIISLSYCSPRCLIFWRAGNRVNMRAK